MLIRPQQPDRPRVNAVVACLRLGGKDELRRRPLLGPELLEDYKYIIDLSVLRPVVAECAPSNGYEYASITQSVRDANEACCHWL